MQESTDEELVALHHQGYTPAIDALLERYRQFARMKARSYFLAGADKDDIVQERMIGLYKAIRDFAPDGEASFRGFAEIGEGQEPPPALDTARRVRRSPTERGRTAPSRR